MPVKLVSGVLAAVCTPRQADGSLDEQALRNELEFLMARGIRGFAVNGATGEYCLTAPDELAAITRVASQATAGRAEFLCGIGSAGFQGCIANAEIALAAGAKALLLPAPHFFPYAQEDVEIFCREVACRVTRPILLYNLPQFTTGFDVQTATTLTGGCENIIGIKDSSGSLDILRALSCPDSRACRIVGNDSVLAQALREGVCDGVVSGVACVLPELLLALFEARAEPESDRFRECCRRLDEFIRAVAPFPVPWALKWVGEARGIVPARFSQPLSESRLRQAGELRAWFEEWLPACEQGLAATA